MVIVLPTVKAYNSGELWDLTITCGDSTFRVHKIVVCNACKFFRKACHFGAGREAEDNRIDLPEDDPETIRRLIMYCYLDGYDPASTKQLETIATFKDCRDQGKLAATYHSRYSYSDSQGFDDGSSDCACCVISDQYSEQGGRGPGLCHVEKEAQVENPLTIHACMYALADKYDVDGLARLAVYKFRMTVPDHWDTADFATCVSFAYSSTPEADRGFRDAVVRAFKRYLNIDLEARPELEKQLAGFDVFSLGLLSAMKSTYES